MEQIKNEAVADVLNGLIKINNDRITGYKLVETDMIGQTLQGTFESMMNESVNFAENLGPYVRDFGGTPATDGTLAGSIHQGWINVKTAILGKDREAILNSCEFGDKAAIEAYEAALQTDEIKNHAELSSVLVRQRASLAQSLRVIENINRQHATNHNPS